MKLLLVSMNSIHFRRWSEQLKDSGHEVFWFDILDQGYAPSMSWMTQITGWKKGFLKRRGRTFLKSKLPKLFNALAHKYDTTVEDAFAKAIQEIQPDVVHSFALYTSGLPIIDIMNKHENVKWIYSSWGSDLFNKANKPNYESEVSQVLHRVNYLITDCERDHQIARNMGFTGTYLGAIPGGGGFDIREFNTQRGNASFVVKGYENELGKAIPVVKALFKIAYNYKISISIFGATQSLLQFIEGQQISNLQLELHRDIAHEEVLELMEKSIFYIGNSLSDGMPNTLLEAIYCGCIPIQSNPGNATSELISNTVNGYLIEEPENVDHIEKLILQALNSSRTIEGFYEANKSIRDRFVRERVIEEVLQLYKALI